MKNLKLKILLSVKILIYNFFILFFLLGLLNYLPPLSINLWRIAHNGLPEKINPISDRYNLPVYSDKEWAKQHFTELSNLKTKYYDYIIWRRDAFKGQTINIDDEGLRYTFVNNKSNEREIIIWAFGGSAMWGTGSRDNETIPSYLAKKYKYKVINYGESGYTSIQNLQMLIRSINNRDKPDYVIFYDGNNDVINQCRSDSSPYASSRQSQIRNTLKEKKYEPSSFSYQFETPKFFISKIKEKLFKNNYVISKSSNSNVSHDCHLNDQKATKISEVLYETWNHTKIILDHYNIKFIPILQPVATLSKTKLDHISIPNIYSKQLKILYPLFKENMIKKNFLFYDMTKVFDKDQYLYIDSVHVMPIGNEIVADEINHIIQTE